MSSSPAVSVFYVRAPRQIQEDTGTSISTKGVWYPDRSKATERDPPLYLHLSASSKPQLQDAIDKINELISLDLGPLVEDKKDRLREKVLFSLPSILAVFLTRLYSASGQRRNFPWG